MYALCTAHPPHIQAQDDNTSRTATINHERQQLRITFYFKPATSTSSTRNPAHLGQRRLCGGHGR